MVHCRRPRRSQPKQIDSVQPRAQHRDRDVSAETGDFEEFVALLPQGQGVVVICRDGGIGKRDTQAQRLALQGRARNTKNRTYAMRLGVKNVSCNDATDRRVMRVQGCESADQNADWSETRALEKSAWHG